MPDTQGKRVIRGTQPAPAPPASTTPSAPSVALAPPGGYTGNNPSPEAQAYYRNVGATLERLIGNKHDEVYTDENGRKCIANSCLSFATTVQEQASGAQIARTKQNLYNPEFTRTAEQQGWVQIPVEKMQPGDRLQSWQPVGTKTANEFKVADLGGRQLLPGRVPVHMTVFGGWQDKPTPGNYGMATVYQDGHERRAADSQVRPIRANEWVAYRYVGAAPAPAQPAPLPRVIAGTAPTLRTIRGTIAATR